MVEKNPPASRETGMRVWRPGEGIVLVGSLASSRDCLGNDVAEGRISTEEYFSRVMAHLTEERNAARELVRDLRREVEEWRLKSVSAHLRKPQGKGAGRRRSRTYTIGWYRQAFRLKEPVTFFQFLAFAVVLGVASYAAGWHSRAALSTYENAFSMEIDQAP